MSYLSQSQAPSNRKLIGVGVAVIVHVFLGYALVTGLALDIAKKIVNEVEAVNIEKEKPPEETPPPPPQKLQPVEIPPISPPPLIQVQNDTPPPIQTVVTRDIPPPAPIQNVTPAPIPQVAPPPAPPAPPVAAVAARPKGDPKSWFSDDDYPESARRASEEGRVQATLNIDERGRVSGCNIISSSNSKALDDATCRIYQRRGRFSPAQATGGAPLAATLTMPPLLWRLPKE